MRITKPNGFSSYVKNLKKNEFNLFCTVSDYVRFCGIPSKVNPLTTISCMTQDRWVVYHSYLGPSFLSGDLEFKVEVEKETDPDLKWEITDVVKIKTRPYSNPYSLIHTFLKV